MELGERTASNLNYDYWYLRDNHVDGKTALRIVSLAYVEVEKCP